MSLSLSLLADSRKRAVIYPVDLVGGTAPLFACGITKLRSAYAGNCMQVFRTSDSTTLNIGFVGAKVDAAAIDAFLGGGQTGHISIWYDQSGNGNDITQTVDASRPLIEGASVTGGQPITLGGLPCPVFNSHTMNLAAALSTSRQANSFYMAAETYGFNYPSCFVQLGSSTNQATLFLGAVTSQTGYLRANPATGNSTFKPQSRVSIYQSILSATASTAQQNSEVISAAAATALTMTGGTIGKTDLGSFPGQYYAGAIINYGRALSTSEDSAMQTALNGLFGITPNPSGRIVFFGDSITAGSNGPALVWFGFAKMATRYLPSRHMYALGQGGTQVNVRLPFYANETGAILAQYSDTRVVLVAIGTNDLTIGARTAAQIYADLQTYCGNVRTSGGKVVIATILPNNAWTAGQQTTRTTVNTNIQTNWATFADGLCDFAADATMGPQAAAANTALYSDGLHPTRFGHVTYLAPIVQAALSALI